jgi:hypothetical protein
MNEAKKYAKKEQMGADSVKEDRLKWDGKKMNYVPTSKA